LNIPPYMVRELSVDSSADYAVLAWKQNPEGLSLNFRGQSEEVRLPVSMRPQPLDRDGSVSRRGHVPRRLVPPLRNPANHNPSGDFEVFFKMPS